MQIGNQEAKGSLMKMKLLTWPGVTRENSRNTITALIHLLPFVLYIS